MSRVTREVREAIITKALAAKFKDREAALQVAISVFADEVYEHTYGAEAVLARTMPTGWINQGRDLIISAPGWNTRYYGACSPDQGPDPRLTLTKDQPMPACSRHQITIGEDHPLLKQANALVKEHHVIINSKETLRSKLNSLLYSTNTFKKLRAAWPEGEQFFPPEVSRSTAIVPISLTRDINRALGLEPKATPVKKAIAKAMAK